MPVHWIIGDIHGMLRPLVRLIEAIMADGTHDAAGIAAGLQARGIVSGGHREWDAAVLSSYLAELANA